MLSKNIFCKPYNENPPTQDEKSRKKKSLRIQITPFSLGTSREEYSQVSRKEI